MHGRAPRHAHPQGADLALRAGPGRRWAGAADAAANTLAVPAAGRRAVGPSCLRRRRLRVPAAGRREVRGVRGHPHPRAARHAPRAHPVGGAHLHDGGLQGAHVLDDVDGAGQAHDRVDGQLPRAVPGGLPAAVNVDDGHALDVVGGRPLPAVGAAPDGVDALVLDQDEGRAAAGGGHLAVHLSLELPGLAVGDEPRAQIEVEALHPRSLAAACRRHSPAPVPAPGSPLRLRARSPLRGPHSGPRPGLPPSAPLWSCLGPVRVPVVVPPLRVLRIWLVGYGWVLVRALLAHPRPRIGTTSDRLLRPFPSATPLCPLLRPFPSYSGG